MKRVVVKNLSNVETHIAEFATQQLAEAWIAEQRAAQSWGRVAYTQTHNENGDELETPINHSDQFTVEIVDVTNEVAFKNAIQTLRRNRAFGQQLADEFAIENVVMGITSAQSTIVMTRLSDIMQALERGYLETALERVHSFNRNQFYLNFITVPRLLSYVNRIETHLGLPLSTDL